MAGFGQDVGNKFVFDQYTIDREQKANQASAGMPNMGNAPDIGGPLAGVDVVGDYTDNYMTTWANLQNFARSMWRKGIDVTAPDLTDPMQRELSKTFMKGLAAVNTAGQDLVNSRDNALLVAKMRATQPDFIGQTSQGPSGITTLDQIGNQGLTSEVKSDIDSNAIAYATQAEVDDANARLDSRADEFAEAQLLTNDPTEIAMLEAQEKALRLARARIDDSVVRAGISARAGNKNERNKRAKQMETAMERHALLDRIVKNNDVSLLNDMTSTKGVTWKRIDDGKENGFAAFNTAGDRLRFVSMDVDDRAVFESDLNQAINELTGQDDVSDELLAKYRDPYWDWLKEFSGDDDIDRPSLSPSRDPDQVSAIIHKFQNPSTYDDALEEFNNIAKTNKGIIIDLPKVGPVNVTKFEPQTAFRWSGFGQSPTGSIVVHYPGSSKGKALDPSNPDHSKRIEDMIRNNIQAFYGAVNTDGVSLPVPQSAEEVISSGTYTSEQEANIREYFASTPQEKRTREGVVRAISGSGTSMSTEVRRDYEILIDRFKANNNRDPKPSELEQIRDIAFSMSSEEDAEPEYDQFATFGME